MTTTLKLRRAFFAQLWRLATALASSVRSTIQNLRSTKAPPRALLAATVAIALTANIASALSTYPHTLSYFNEIAGGPLNGPAHLLDANIDWGQDLLYLLGWCEGQPVPGPFRLAFFTNPEPISSQICVSPLLPESQRDVAGLATTQADDFSGWDLISVNHLFAYRHFGIRNDDFKSLRSSARTAHIGYSIIVYRFGSCDAN